MFATPRWGSVQSCTDRAVGCSTTGACGSPAAIIWTGSASCSPWTTSRFPSSSATGRTPSSCFPRTVMRCRCGWPSCSIEWCAGGVNGANRGTPGQVHSSPESSGAHARPSALPPRAIDGPARWCTPPGSRPSGSTIQSVRSRASDFWHCEALEGAVDRLSPTVPRSSTDVRSRSEVHSRKLTDPPARRCHALPGGGAGTRDLPLGRHGGCSPRRPTSGWATCLPGAPHGWNVWAFRPWDRTT